MRKTYPNRTHGAQNKRNGRQGKEARQKRALQRFNDAVLKWNDKEQSIMRDYKLENAWKNVRALQTKGIE